MPTKQPKSSAATPRLSAIICTHNRADVLEGAVRSLAEQNFAKQDYEILVIDNASTDETALLLAALEKEIANLRVIAEPTLGLSRARNTGWQNAQGEIVAYMDDDARAEKDWLQAIDTAFLTTDPRPAAVGGKVLPIWPASGKPEWVTGILLDQLSLLDKGPGISDVSETGWLVGTNMAFAKSTLNENGGFHEEFGRKGLNLESHEEAVLIGELQKQGLRVMYNGSMVVRHVIAIERLDVKWFMRRSFEDGLCTATMDIETRQLGGDARLSHSHDTMMEMAEIFTAENDTQSQIEDRCKRIRFLGYIARLQEGCWEYRPIATMQKQNGMFRKTVLEQDVKIGSFEAEMRRRDGQIANLEAETKERDQRIGLLDVEKRDRDEKIGVLEDEKRQQDERIGVLEDEKRERDRKIGVLEDEKRERDRKIGALSENAAKLQQDLSQARIRIALLEGEKVVLEQRIEHVLQSLSYKTGSLIMFIPRKCAALLRRMRKDAYAPPHK